MQDIVTNSHISCVFDLSLLTAYLIRSPANLCMASIIDMELL